ncbi:PTS system IIC component [Lacticaseibacillus paracasei]|nr:PTS system IIC component [Lacticaseibacillus paracasei]
MYLAGVINYLISLNKTTVIEFIATLIQEPLLNMSQGFWAVLLMTLLVQIFWFFGLHGTDVLGPVLDSIWLTAQIANMNAFMKGEALPFVWTRNAFDLYAWIGGAGSTLLLLLAILLFSKRDDQRTVAKLSIAPGCFNVNEPVMFGLPIVLDPIYFIPFILAPVVMVSIAYGAHILGWVSPVKNQNRLVNATVCQLADCNHGLARTDSTGSQYGHRVLDLCAIRQSGQQAGP